MEDTLIDAVGLSGMVFDGSGTASVDSLDALLSGLASPGAFGYLEVRDPDRLEFGELARRLGAADLSRQPTGTAGHAPTVVDGGQVRLSARRVQLEAPTIQLTVADLHIYVLPRVLILDHDGSLDMARLRERFDEETRHRDQGVGWLLWILLDQLLAEAGSALETLDDELEGIEEQLLETGAKAAAVQARTYRLRKSTAQLRRCLLPLRDAVDALLRREADCVTAGLVPLFQGLYDRGVHQVEWADSLRDLVTALSDTQLAMESNRLNVVMKKVTSWAAIIALPAAITGFYGQNLPYPGFNTVWGFWTSTILMLGGCALLYTTFKRKDWL